MSQNQNQNQNQRKPDTIFVLLSGGIDSATCLFKAVADIKSGFYGDRARIKAISVHYGQRHEKELEHASMLCEHINGLYGTTVVHKVVELAQQPPSMLTDPDSEVPNASYDELPAGISPTYVPFRNGQMLSYAAAIAHADYGMAIYYGAHAEDAARWAYPDCTPEFNGAMANAIFIGTYQQVRLVTPLQWLTKREIIQLGMELDVPYQLTWSCYKGGTMHCGTCPTCRARAQGFHDAGYVDPTKYENPPTLKLTTATVQPPRQGEVSAR
jgi:7-cyano-7-deazaguanine synthase